MATRWGIVGCGFISSDFCLAIRALPAEEHTIIAVAARKLENAEDFAKRHHAKRVYDSYDKIAEDPEIDVVYIGVIHPFHAQLSIQMLKAGKHVVCEKPMGMSAAETKSVIKTAQETGKLFIEGLWSRFFPVYARLKQELASKSIGEVRSVSVHFGFNFNEKDHARVFDKELGGGVALDIGLYAVQFANLVFNQEKPEKIIVAGYKFHTGVDKKYSATLQYSGDRMAQFLIAGDARLSNKAYVFGSEGMIEVPQFWCPEEILVTNNSFKYPAPPTPEPTHYTNSNGFVYEITAARNAILNGLTEVQEAKHSDSILIAEITDEVLKQLEVSYS